MCHALGNSCRIGGDDTNWRGVLSDIDAMAPLYPYAGPGGFMDPCLLLGRDSQGNVAVTDMQGRAQFSMWATLAAPMLLSSNVRNLTAMQRETYLNAEVIAVGQDVLGRQGQRLVGGPLSGGGANPPATASACAPGSAAQAWALDAPMPGYIQNVGGLCLNTDVSVRGARGGRAGGAPLPAWNVAPPRGHARLIFFPHLPPLLQDCGSDIIMFECLTSGGSCCGPTCLDVLKFSLGADGSLTTPSQPGACVTAGGLGDQVTLTPCASPPAAAQTWAYAAGDKTLTTAGGAACLTAGAPAGSALANVWGRPLADGAWALTFINADTAPVDLACGGACLMATGWDANTNLTVRDLWAHEMLPTTSVAAGLNVSGLAPNGGVAMFRVTPVW